LWLWISDAIRNSLEFLSEILTAIRYTKLQAPWIVCDIQVQIQRVAQGCSFPQDPGSASDIELHQEWLW
jgi:hypothetical protein